MVFGEPSLGPLTALAVQQLQERRVCQRFGVGSLQAVQFVCIDHVKPGLVQPRCKVVISNRVFPHITPMPTPNTWERMPA